MRFFIIVAGGILVGVGFESLVVGIGMFALALGIIWEG